MNEPPPAAGDASRPVYIPGRLRDVLGQDRAVGTLSKALDSGRLHHAWIFHGPAGVGKFTTALAFASVLLDPTSEPGTGGVYITHEDSPTQQRLAAGTDPDLHVITKELASFSREDSARRSKQTSIAKAVIDEFLIEPAARTAAISRASKAGKVFIVDEAEMLNTASQNELLKTLEEPGPGTVIILVTSAEDRLLPTIRSRCQRVSFVPLSDADMSRWIAASGLECDESERRWLLSYAAGAPGAAWAAHEAGLFAWQSAIAPMLDRVLGGTPVMELGSAMAKLVDERAAAVVEGKDNASKDAANRAAARQMFALVADHCRGKLRSGDVDAGLRGIELTREAERLMDTNVQLATVMDNLAAQLASGS